MQGLKRRLVYVGLFETIAIASATLLTMAFTGAGPAHAGAISAATSVIAVVWNFAYNTAFEAWEARQTVRGRSTRRRIAHTLGFEGGLALIMVPLIAWWLGISLLEAFVLDVGLLAFFLFYTYGFSLAFDRVFGLPASAAPDCAA